MRVLFQRLLPSFQGLFQQGVGITMQDSAVFAQNWLFKASTILLLKDFITGSCFGP
jgi:hypothetical protein